MLKSIPIDELKPGMMVTRVIEQHGPVKIRRVGIIKSEAMVKGLTEMGVTLLEVDEAQSFTLETEEGMAGADDDTYSELTPTQRLMQEDKQSAVVDRQLSQQFHRSLFMPAIDEMPSKWRLYFRPYAILAGVIFAGFILGFLALMMIKQLAFSDNSTSSAMTGSEQRQTVQSLPLQNTLADDALGEDMPSAPASTISKAPDNSSSAVDTQRTANQVATSAPTPVADEQVNSESQPDIEQPAASQTSSSTNTDATRSFQSINGIVLNEGETVLGYGADESLDLNQNSAGSDQNPTTNSALSSDLLNRVNRAAAQLEAEQDVSSSESLPPSEAVDLSEFLRNDNVGPVLDLRSPEPQAQASPKQTVRIDQLPPAVLTQMPAMSFSAHMFASNPQDRWVRVNGRRLSEGDFIDDGLSIVEIESERIVLSFKGETFTMNALSDW
ncbi:general secretion pathway protein GspB [Glaciecola sp. SC05]|uniref:general secretion pathway protein GspB n=1 Tax=Glaciecola sp. SC05 TaxID=1987355 RepID=UPI003527FDEE